VPFATTTRARLSSWSAWEGRLGVMPEGIEPGKPQPNGRHERRHRTLQAETTRPPAHRWRAQQRQCKRFRNKSNTERPHEALDMRPPDQLYSPSPRPLPHRLPALEYPDRFAVRSVSATGGLRGNRAWVNVSTVCVGESVGFEEIDDGIGNVSCGALKLGRFNERHMSIEAEFGRLRRHHV
jgi:putative transposase